MFGLMKSLGGLAADVAQVIVAPAEMAADVAASAVKPVAEVAKELVAALKSPKD